MVIDRRELMVEGSWVFLIVVESSACCVLWRASNSNQNLELASSDLFAPKNRRELLFSRVSWRYTRRLIVRYVPSYMRLLLLLLPPTSSTPRAPARYYRLIVQPLVYITYWPWNLFILLHCFLLSSSSLQWMFVLRSYHLWALLVCQDQTKKSMQLLYLMMKMTTGSNNLGDET